MRGEKYLVEKVKRMESSDAGIMAGIKIRIAVILIAIALGWFACDRIVSLVASAS